jgi:hypothetical protein
MGRDEMLVKARDVCEEIKYLQISGRTKRTEEYFIRKHSERDWTFHGLKGDDLEIN